MATGSPRTSLAMALQINTRTHCDCGEALAPVKEVGGNWGDWRCRKCWFRYCQDCGSHLDQNDECIAYRDSQEESSGA